MDVLVKPIITEKMTRSSEKLGRYGFVVDSRANKLQIKNAVEKIRLLQQSLITRNL